MKRWMIWSLVGLAFLSPVKFGTPVVLQSLVPPPGGIFEWIFFSWPNQVGVLLAFLTMIWALADPHRNRTRCDLLFLLPGLFLVTQVAALSGSINHQVSVETTWHFATCVLLFYAAAWYVRDGAAVGWVFGGIGLATFLVCVFGMDQWGGGLEATRQLAAHSPPQHPLPPELLARLRSNRVFSTLVYPNALAGFLVVAFAPVLAWIWVRGRTWERRTKWATLGLAAAVMVWCLLLTGSRGGFVAFVLAVLAGAWGCVGGRRRGVLAMIVLALVAVFAIATWGRWMGLGTHSFSARVEYWSGAMRIVQDHPLTGTGPGTFGSIYPHYKTGQTEEAQVAHNNFLQMWTDSGVAAFIVFLALWLVAVREAYRLVRQRPGDAAAIAIGASLVGWTAHGFVDFDLYVPGVAWPLFILLGALQGLKEPPEPSRPSVLAKWRWAGMAGALVLAAAVAWVQGRSLGASFLHGRVLALQTINPRGAYAMCQQLVEFAPRNSHYLANLGDLAAELGERSEALNAYEEALRNDPYRASYHWHLAKLFGPTPEGVEHLRQAVALNPAKTEYRMALRDYEESVRQHR